MREQSGGLWIAHFDPSRSELTDAPVRQLDKLDGAAGFLISDAAFFPAELTSKQEREMCPDWDDDAVDTSSMRPVSLPSGLCRSPIQIIAAVPLTLMLFRFDNRLALFRVLMICLRSHR